MITWKIPTWDSGITILGSQLTGLAWLSYNHKVDFCCIELRCRNFCKVSQPGSCYQALSSSQVLRPSPWPHWFFKAPRTHTHNFSLPPPRQHLHSPFSIWNEPCLIFVLSIQILSKITKNNPKQKTYQQNLTAFVLGLQLSLLCRLQGTGLIPSWRWQPIFQKHVTLPSIICIIWDA